MRGGWGHVASRTVLGPSLTFPGRCEVVKMFLHLTTAWEICYLRTLPLVGTICQLASQNDCIWSLTFEVMQTHHGDCEGPFLDFAVSR